MSGSTTRMRLGEGLDDDRTDWRRVDALGEAELADAIARDPDTFAPDAAWLKEATILRPARPKERLTVRLDADLVRWFKQQGHDYQSRMNAVLRAYYEHERRKTRP